MKINRRTTKLVENLLKLSLDQRGEIIEGKAKKFSQILLKLPYYLAIPALSEYVKRLKNEQRKKVVIIESAQVLPQQSIEQIFDSVSRQFSVSRVESSINPSLLGGLRVKIGDMVYDDSIRLKITQIKGAING